MLNVIERLRGLRRGPALLHSVGLCAACCGVEVQSQLVLGVLLEVVAWEVDIGVVHCCEW